MEKDKESSQIKSLYRYWIFGVTFYVGIIVYFMAQLIYKYQIQFYYKPLDVFTGDTAKKDFENFVCNGFNLNNQLSGHII